MAYKPRKNPTNIPSQDPSTQKPYSPLIQPDVAQFPKLQKSYPTGWGPVDAFVISTYDSRPLNAADFLVGGFGSEFSFSVDEVLVSFFFEYTPPVGRLAILREWSFDAFTGTEPSTSTAALTTNDGIPVPSEFLVRMNFQIDRADFPEYSNVPHQDAIFGTIGAETFIVVPPGSTLRAEAKISGGPEPDVDEQQGYFRLYGNLLLATGQNTQFEQATQEPIPVTTKRKVGFEYQEGQ